MENNQEQHSSADAILGQVQNEVTDWVAAHVDLIAASEQASYRAGMHHDSQSQLNAAIAEGRHRAVIAHLSELIKIVSSL